jgi:hypothetical protein
MLSFPKNQPKTTPMKFLAAGLSIAFFTAGAQAGCYEQLKQRLPDAATIIFGELHGSAEIPKFFFDCAREFVDKKEAVTIFLEFPASGNAVVDRFLRGEIGEDDFIKAPLWTRQDGRASLAMLGLFRDLKTLAASRLPLSGSGSVAGPVSGPIPVFGFDLSGYEPDREKSMLRNFLSTYSPTGYNLVLTGNVHAMLTSGTAWNPDFVPFGKHLRDHAANVVSLDARYPAGSAWVCMPQCGVTPLTGTDSSAHAPASIVFSSENPAYSGIFLVPSLTASRPLIEK